MSSKQGRSSGARAENGPVKRENPQEPPKKPKNLYIKITGMSQKLDEKTLKTSIIIQNVSLNTGFGLFRIVNCRQTDKKYATIIQVDPTSFTKILKLKKLSVGDDSCGVFVDYGVRRCFGCGYSNSVNSDGSTNSVCPQCSANLHQKRQWRNCDCYYCKKGREEWKLKVRSESQRPK